MVRFITTFSDQHTHIHEIMQRHWHLLLGDNTMCKYKYLSDRPEITFKRLGSIRDRLVRSQYARSSRQQQDTPGIFRCGSCDYCHLLMEGPSLTLPDGRVHKIRHHISYLNKGIIYIILCQCGAFYIGKTIRSFWKRMKDHIYYATCGILNTAIGHHVAFKHRYDPHVFRFAALDRIYEDPRGGNFDQWVLQREIKWVYDLLATSFPGLNDVLSFRPFLK